MSCDFDEPVDRSGTASLKWDYSRELTGVDGLLPLWVADMDFRAPQEVVQALTARAQHGVFGYTREPESYFQAVIDWMRQRHGWKIRREWLVSAPGVVPSINLAILAFSDPGDRVIIQPPVYYPFKESIRRNGRRVLENPLRLGKHGYTMDFRQLEAQIDDRTRLLLLCSPHNPVGRVWRRPELERLVDICARRDLTILSDEIHHDLTMDGHRHLPTAGLSPLASRLTVAFTSATKTFNLAGVGCSMAVIPDEPRRRRFRRTRDRFWTGLANAFSVLAAETAYRRGQPWLDQVLRYIGANYRFLLTTLARTVPAARVLPLEGTYLAWIDLRALRLGDREIKERIRDRARLWLDDGPMFGTGGEGFQRLNLACPRRTLAEALSRLAAALQS